MTARFADFLTGPAVLYLVLAALVAEGALLVFWQHRVGAAPRRGTAAQHRGTGVRALRGLFANLGAGGGLVLAMLTAAHGGPATAVGLLLAASLAAHLVDLRERLRYWPGIRAGGAHERDGQSPSPQEPEP